MMVWLEWVQVSAPAAAVMHLMADVVGKHLLQFNAGTNVLRIIFADFSQLGLGIN
jgi:hypothetical protein